jgi:hypothetical protein
LDKESEMGIKLGAAAGNIDTQAGVIPEEGDDLLHCGSGHYLAALRSCLDVTMDATLIASVAEIDLKDLKCVKTEQLRVGVGDCLFELDNHSCIPVFLLSVMNSKL